MFPGVKTWSPATGCTHGCPYCSAEKRTLPRVRGKPKYEFGWTPMVHFDILRKGPPKAETVFVVYMGDLFCTGFELAEIAEVLDVCHRAPADRVKNFLLMTKNPWRYHEVLNKYPALLQDGRFIFGSTIETNQDNLRSLASNAPSPSSRLKALTELRRAYQAPRIRLAVSMEPIMEFNAAEMLQWLAFRIKPEIVWVGYDGYNYVPGDDEPTLQKTRDLMSALRSGGLNVVEKLIRERKGV
jgi:DNA repair photolyase